MTKNNVERKRAPRLLIQEVQRVFVQLRVMRSKRQMTTDSGRGVITVSRKCEVDSLGHGFGSPVEDVPGQDAPDQGELPLLPSQVVQGLDHLLVVLERHVVLPLLDLQHSGGTTRQIKPSHD